MNAAAARSNTGMPMAAVAGMLALASSIGVGRFVYTPILPSMAAALGLSKGASGLIASANFAGYLVGALLAASPRLHGGPRAWFAAALSAGAATTVGMAFADGLPTILALRFFGGAASAFVLVLGTASVLDALASAGRPGWRWLHYSGVGLGIAASAAAVTWLEAAGSDWRTLWLVPGVAAALLVPVPVVILRWPTKPEPVTGRGAAGTRPASGIVPLAICHGLFGFGYIVTATFLVAVVRASASTRSVEPAVWMIVGLTAVPSTLVWDVVAARLGVRPAYALACCILAVGVVSGGCWPSVPGVLLGAALLGATFMGVTALGFAAAREFGSVAQARSFALLTAAFGTGQAIGPTLGGALFDVTGSFAAASALAAAALLTAAVLVIGSRGRLPVTGSV